MRTPAGYDCRHYHADFHRGRNIQECRLAKENPTFLNWQPSDCARCSVPDILNANASPNMQLILTIKSGFLGFGRRNEVKASCIKHRIPVEDPYTGCAQCNADRPGIDVFLQALGQDEDTE